MEKDTLTTILDEERSIQKEIATERSRATERLEQLKLETTAEFAREEERLATGNEEALAAARADAAKAAAELVTEAALLAEKLHRLDDRNLLAITLRHLGVILPGRCNDRQNVEN